MQASQSPQSCFCWIFFWPSAARRYRRRPYTYTPAYRGFVKTRIAVETVSGRNTVAPPVRLDGNPRPSFRKVFTVWHAEPTREYVSKKWTIVSRICASGSRATLPTSSYTKPVGNGHRYSPRRTLL